MPGRDGQSQCSGGLTVESNESFVKAVPFVAFLLDVASLLDFSRNPKVDGDDPQGTAFLAIRMIFRRRGRPATTITSGSLETNSLSPGLTAEVPLASARRRDSSASAQSDSEERWEDGKQTRCDK